jgi:hypothetical protein
MKKVNTLLRKMAYVVLVLGIALAAFPVLGASAAGMDDPSNPPAARSGNTRIERLWTHQQAVFQRQSRRLSEATGFIAHVQQLIDKGTQKGWDTASVQSALDALSSVIPAAQAAHEPGAVVIASHAGFDENGVVTDRTLAIATEKSLAQVIKNTRTAMDGTGRALREAIRAFRDAHKQSPSIAP